MLNKKSKKKIIVSMLVLWEKKFLRKVLVVPYSPKDILYVGYWISFEESLEQIEHKELCPFPSLNHTNVGL